MCQSIKRRQSAPEMRAPVKVRGDRVRVSRYFPVSWGCGRQFQGQFMGPDTKAATPRKEVRERRSFSLYEFAIVLGQVVAELRTRRLISSERVLGD